MRTFSVKNGKLVVSPKCIPATSAMELGHDVEIGNVFIDDAVVSSDVNTNEAVIIKTLDGGIDTITIYLDGDGYISHKNLVKRSALPIHSSGHAHFAQSFNDWYNEVKGTDVTLSSHFDIIDNKLVVTTDGEIITHEISGTVASAGWNVYTTGGNQRLNISFDKHTGNFRTINFSDDTGHYYFLINKGSVFTPAFVQWYLTAKENGVRLPRTFSVEGDQLVVKYDGDRILKSDIIVNTFINGVQKYANPHTENAVYFRTVVEDDKEVLLSIDIYDGRKAHYFHLKSKHSTLEQSFIDWYNAVKAMPAIA